MDLVEAFITRFKEDDAFATTVVSAVNEKGQSYFGGSRSGYISPDIDLKVARDYLRTYTKEQFANMYEDMTGSDYYENELLLHTAVSDAFRHAIVVDMTDPAHPAFLPVTDPRFTGMTDDYVFTWAGVAALAAKYPTMFVLHADTEDELRLYIPVA